MGASPIVAMSWERKSTLEVVSQEEQMMTTNERIPRFIYIVGVALIGCVILFGGLVGNRYEAPGNDQRVIRSW